jgi:hypothetical protein
MVVNLKVPALLKVIPSQGKVRDASSPLFFPAIKPTPDFIGDKPSRPFNISLG